MKKLFSFFTIALFLCFSINSIAQVSTKFFTQFSGAYTEVVGGTLVAAATATTGAGGLDDLNFSAQPIPFTFNYNGTDYTEYNINTNGYITFGATLPAAGSPYTPISNSAAYDGAISGIGRDLWGLFRTTGTRTLGSDVLTDVVNFDGVAVGLFITGTGIPGTTSVPTTTIVSFDEGAGTITMSAAATSGTPTVTTITMTSGDIRSETIGAIGSRVHTIQYRDFARFAGSNENLNFQIKLYETSNIIEVVYGSNTTLNGTSAAPQVGLRGLTNADFNNRTGTDWSASTAGGINTASMTLNSSSLPASGQTYNWDAPPACNITITNLNPTGTILPGCGTTYAPKVNLVNGGTDDQTDISVNYAVGAYSETVTGLSITAGGNMDVDFPNTLSYTSFDAGVKNVTITVNSTCNSNPEVYVLNTDFTVSSENPNFGGPVDGYYFANSTTGASCAPDQPFVEWEDTTGSTNLLLNGRNVSPSGTLFGSIDDGFFALGDAIDGVQRFFRYQGVDYDSFFVGTNGMIAFSRANNTQAQLTTFTTQAIPSTTAPRPAIFPFWKDFNYSDSIDVPVSRLSYKATADKFIITYDRAPNFNTAADPDDYVSFQVVMEISTAPTEDGWIQVNYNEGGTGSTFLTKYFGLTLPGHTVGQQNEAGNSAIQYRRVVLSTITDAGPLFTSSVSVAYGPNENALPVELASFTATTNANNVDLNWSTTSETNNAGFDIERSTEIGSWAKIGNVAGNGTTTSAQSYTYRDKNVATGNYNYRLKQIDFNGNFEYFNLSNEVNVGIPTKFDLSQNYPNPFNPSTSINFDLPVDGKVSLKIYDMTGKEVMTLVNEVRSAGYYSVNFNASNLSSGAYFYILSADNFTATKKMMLLK
ncbi:MAG: T9SS type A sorting domain-containing protein [Ignavibacteria bacterium]|nr:T9SS type A sorting domain-containing protein [Ignavibacteria bacterium]